VIDLGGFDGQIVALTDQHSDLLADRRRLLAVVGGPPAGHYLVGHAGLGRQPVHRPSEDLGFLRAELVDLGHKVTLEPTA